MADNPWDMPSGDGKPSRVDRIAKRRQQLLAAGGRDVSFAPKHCTECGVSVAATEGRWLRPWPGEEWLCHDCSEWRQARTGEGRTDVTGD